MFAPMMQYRDGRPNDSISMRVVGETPKLPMLTDMRARLPLPIKPQISIDQQMDSPDYQSLLTRLQSSGGQDQDAKRQLEAYQSKFAQQQPRPTPLTVQQRTGFSGAMEQAGQQPQFNQQGMQQMMQFMQQMMQMFSMMSGQGGQGGFGGGFNQRPPMFGGGYGGGMGGGFGQGGYQQIQQPQQRPMPRYPRMQNNYSQSPFGRY